MEIDNVFGIAGFFISLYLLLQPSAARLLRHTYLKLYNKVNQEKIFNWLARYHRKRGSDKELYKCTFSETKRIPFLVREEWLKFEDETTFSSNLLRPVDESIRPYQLTPRAKKLINRRRTLFNQELFDAITICFHSYDKESNSLKYTKHHYFELARSMIEFENELYNAIISKIKRTWIRDKYLSSIDCVLQNAEHRRYSIGASIASCLKKENGNYEVLVHKRSEKVVTSRGIHSVIPQFGFEPISREFEKQRLDNGEPASLSLVFFNILKEFCEELFNYEHLIDNIRNREILGAIEDIDKFDLLKKLHENNQLRIMYLGFGIECLSGVVNLGFLLMLDDVPTAQNLKREIAVNFEVDRFDGNEGIEYFEISHTGIKLLNDRMNSSDFTAASLFTLSRAVEWMKANNLIKD